MTKLPPDPGGVFDSDAHRRVLAFLRAPHDDGEGVHDAGAPMVVTSPGTWEASLSDRLAADLFFQTSGADVTDILSDLESDGFVEERPEGYIMTATGFAALNGPNAYEPPPMTQAMIDAMVSDGTLNDDEVAAWREAHDAWQEETNA